MAAMALQAVTAVLNNFELVVDFENYMNHCRLVLHVAASDAFAATVLKALHNVLGIS